MNNLYLFGQFLIHWLVVKHNHLDSMEIKSLAKVVSMPWRSYLEVSLAQPFDSAMCNACLGGVTIHGRKLLLTEFNN